jgi:hypothetical protein
MISKLFVDILEPYSIIKIAERGKTRKLGHESKLGNSKNVYMNSEFLIYSYTLDILEPYSILKIVERGKTRKLGHKNRQGNSKNVYEF